MRDFESLRDILKTTPILLVDSDNEDCRLLTAAEMLERMTNASEAGTMMNLLAAAINFWNLTGRKNRTFTISDLQTICALPRPTLDSWIARGLFVPSIRDSDGHGGRGSERQFSWCDVYLAGVLASLRRQGVALPMLARVSQLLTHAAALVDG